MPTYYLLNEDEKNVVLKMREGIKPLTHEDYETIFIEALYNQWKSSGRDEPQNSLSYWMAVATRQYVLHQLGIKDD
jgi:hypothetical protein